ncbi:MAG: FtsL-like putative cell division protein [Bacteroidota bacterium]|nr:FtsL-like putative cell division protein [Bacteroidota bacterium]
MRKNELKEEHPKSRINKLIDFDLKMSDNSLPKIAPFILFISVLIVLYIGNKYYNEDAILERGKLKNELKDLRAESLTNKADLMNRIKKSEIEIMAKKIGLKEFNEPPKIIIVEKGEY